MTTGEIAGSALARQFRQRAENLLAMADALEAAECTGLAATWCPLHGDCSCRARENSLDDPGCPLHAPSSEHATKEHAIKAEPPPVRPARGSTRTCVGCRQPVTWEYKRGLGWAWLTIRQYEATTSYCYPFEPGERGQMRHRVETEA